MPIGVSRPYLSPPPPLLRWRRRGAMSSSVQSSQRKRSDSANIREFEAVAYMEVLGHLNNPLRNVRSPLRTLMWGLDIPRQQASILLASAVQRAYPLTQEGNLIRPSVTCEGPLSGQVRPVAYA